MTAQEIDLTEIDNRIRTIKKAAEELKRMSDNFPALNRGSVRILASLKVLEINISDVLDIGG